MADTSELDVGPFSLTRPNPTQPTELFSKEVTQPILAYYSLQLQYVFKLMNCYVQALDLVS